MTKSRVNAETNVNSRDRSNSRILSNGSIAETLSWNEGSISSTSSSKISKGKNAGNKEEGRRPAFWSGKPVCARYIFMCSLINSREIMIMT